MKTYLFIPTIVLFTASLLITGCNSDSATSSDEIIRATGGVRYGGDFRFMSKEKVTTLFPLNVTDAYSGRLINQLYEGLLRLDPSSLEVVPGIAKSYEISPDAKTFTFNLRDDVYFHDNACFEDGIGRKVTAKDFKFLFETICSKHELNKLGWLVTDKIKGGKAFYAGEVENLEGVKVIDDFTLEIELTNPFSAFDKLLTHYGLTIFPAEALSHYGNDIIQNPVGTGAFKLSQYDDEQIILTRNPNYWRKDDFGNKLPFLDNIVMKYSQNKTDELLSFRAEKIDLVMDIPVEEVENVLGTLAEAQEGKNVKHKVDSKTSMSIQYYGFNHAHEAFSKKEVRKAFNLAIDRESIIDTWLEGEGWASKYGFVPKMPGYPHKNIKGYSFDPEQAKQLMSIAGYPEGKNFPTIDLYVNALEGSGIHRLAQAVAFSLNQHLGVNVSIKLCSIEEREEAIKAGKAIFWRTGWIADYPDPENFLNLFYVGEGKEIDTDINPFGYQNKNFDRLFEKALAESDQAKRMELLVQCDQIIIDDAVVMPLLTDDFITMINLKVRGFVSNEMEFLDFSTIFIKEIN